MKKVFLMLLVMGFCSTCFAGIMTQASYGAGIKTLSGEHEAQCDFTVVGEMLLNVGWEFQSQKDSFVHFSIGTAFGAVAEEFFPLYVIGSASFNVLDIGTFKLQIAPSIAVGNELGFMWDTATHNTFVFRAGVDAVLMNSNRRGFYSGLGFVYDKFDIPAARSDLDILYYGGNQIGMRMFAGLKL